MQNLVFQNISVDELAETIIKKLGANPNRTEKTPTEYLTRRQLADLLSVDLATVHRWAKEGKLPSYRLGGRVFFKRAEVEANMSARPNLKEGRRQK